MNTIPPKNMPPVGKIDSSWYYILVVPDDDPEPVLVYQGYTPSSVALIRLVQAVLHLPPTIHSHQHLAEKLARYRLCASQQIRCAPLTVGKLHLLPFDSALSLQAFLSTKETDTKTADILAKVRHPVLHITSGQVTRILEEPGYGTMLLIDYAKNIAAFLSEKSPQQGTQILSEVEQECPPKRMRLIHHPRHNHNVTIPNEVPIELSGGQFQEEKQFSTFDDSGYIDAIKRSALFMKDERNRLHNAFPDGFHRQTTDLIIACPGILFHLNSSRRLRTLMSGPDAPREFRQAFRLWTRQEGYSMKVTSKEVELLANSTYYRFFAERWHEEISAFTTALIFQSFNEFCPVIRLPRWLYRSRGKIAMLGNLLRDPKVDPKPESVNKLTNQICREMEEVAGGILDGFLDGYDRSIRIAADVPLGWIRSEGIPLTLRHYVSQLPTTPGSLFMGLSLVTPRRFFNISVRQKVVVIRSFSSTDPLRNLLEGSINDYATQEGWDFDVEFIDVSDEAGFVAACGKVQSPFLIFDGHGSHSSEGQIGAIHIGDTRLDVWQLRHKVAMPPCVILSCCDASPSDRSHASTANGFLTLGAWSVFAPIFPVYGSSSALMVARLLYRITTVSRLWIEQHRLPLSWLQIVTSQIRACYTTDLLLQLVNQGLLQEGDYHEISPRVTCAINEFFPKWHELLRSAIIAKCGWTSEDYESYVEKHYTVPQALHYLQLGLPDKILLCSEKFFSKMQDDDH